MDIPLFATPLLVHRFSKHQEYTDRIQLFERSSQKPSDWICDLHTTFPNVDDNDVHLGGIVSDLKRDMLEEVKRIMREYDMTDQIMFNTFWYNAYLDGQGQELHNHLCSHNLCNPFWAGVYFHRNCHQGSFTFQNVNTELRTQQHHNWRKTRLAHYYNDIICPPIDDGDIILFPPHLYHSVKTDERNAKDMRLTFSFNVIIDAT